MNGDSNGIAGAYIKATSRKSNFPQVRFEKFLVKKRITARYKFCDGELKMTDS